MSYKYKVFGEELARKKPITCNKFNATCVVIENRIALFAPACVLLEEVKNNYYQHRF